MGKVCCEWLAVADARESTHAKMQLLNDPKTWDKALSELAFGDAVQIQNQRGNKPRKWYMRQE